MAIDTLQILRILHHETFTSGAHIAEQLGISRARVSQALQRAEEYGVQLQRRVGVGYRLSNAIDWLEANKVHDLLGTQRAYYSISIASYIGSTNKILLADNKAPDGRVLAAEWQSQGRGRLGRIWQGHVGGSLMFSLKKIFPHGIARLSGLSLAVGVAIIRGLRATKVQGAALKWPNDNICPQGKLGGVLIEVSGDALGPSEVVIGIGLNCGLTEPLKSDQVYADLQSLGLKQDRNQVLANLLISLYTVLEQFEKEGFSPFMAEWEAYHLWQNDMVEVIQGQQKKVYGKAIGVTQEGALRLMVEQSEQVFVSGDISLRRYR